MTCRWPFIPAVSSFSISNSFSTLGGLYAALISNDKTSLRTSTTIPGPTALGSSAMRPLLRKGPEKHLWLKYTLGVQSVPWPARRQLKQRSWLSPVHMPKHGNKYFTHFFSVNHTEKSFNFVLESHLFFFLQFRLSGSRFYLADVSPAMGISIQDICSCYGL